MYTLDDRSQAAVRPQIQDAVAGRGIIQGEGFHTGLELDAGGRRRQQVEHPATAAPFLVHMPEEDAPHLAMTIQDGKEFLRIAQTDGIDPAAADGHGRMVQGDEGRELRPLLQHAVEKGQLTVGKKTSLLAGKHGIEKDDVPASPFPATLVSDCLAGEMAVHDPGPIVVAGNKQDRDPEFR